MNYHRPSPVLEFANRSVWEYCLHCSKPWPCPDADLPGDAA